MTKTANEDTEEALKREEEALGREAERLLKAREIDQWDKVMLRRMEVLWKLMHAIRRDHGHA